MASGIHRNRFGTGATKRSIAAVAPSGERGTHSDAGGWLGRQCRNAAIWTPAGDYRDVHDGRCTGQLESTGARSHVSDAFWSAVPLRTRAPFPGHQPATRGTGRFYEMRLSTHGMGHGCSSDGPMAERRSDGPLRHG